MTEDELLAAAAGLGLRLDRRIARELAGEVQRLRDAAQRLRELPLDPERPPGQPEPDGR